MQQFQRSMDPGLPTSSAAVTWGVFDGVHLGHRMVLDRLIEVARATGVPARVLLLDHDPDEVLVADGRQSRLTTVDARCRLLTEFGVDDVVRVEVDHAFAAQHPWEFVDHFLVGVCAASTVVVGRGARFGSRVADTVQSLHDYAARRGLDVVEVPMLSGPPDSECSLDSEDIRSLVRRGEVDEAATYMGRPVRVEGTVVHGEARGRGLGFPTANVQWTSQSMIPPDGVYAGWLVTEPYRAAPRCLPAAISVGTNPTFTGRIRTVEAHVLGRDDLDLYAAYVAVDFAAKIRDQRTFRGPTAIADLCEQMAQDVDEAARLVDVGARFESVLASASAIK